MNTPIVTENYYKEREGVLKVAMELNKHGYVFRELSNGDVGIDGQIEKANEKGQVTGKIVAVQIKSGNSYLPAKEDHYIFYPQKKHANYWANFPLPVILFVNYPKDERIYFTDVRYQLNIPNKKNNNIILNKNIYLNSSNVHLIFETTGDFGIPYHTIDKVFDIMISSNSSNPTFDISYLDLFTQGLTNLCRHIYFGIDLVTHIANFNNRSELGLGIGCNEHEFLHNFTKFIMSQNLVHIDYSDFLIDWKERELQPSFYARLNNRGRQLLEYIKSIEAKYKDQLRATTLVRERNIGMKFSSQSDYLRLEFARKLKEIIL